MRKIELRLDPKGGYSVEVKGEVEVEEEVEGSEPGQVRHRAGPEEGTSMIIDNTALYN